MLNEMRKSLLANQNKPFRNLDVIDENSGSSKSGLIDSDKMRFSDHDLLFFCYQIAKGIF